MPDTRTLGTMISRIASELQRDDLGTLLDPLSDEVASIQNAVYDAIYDYQRESFFISDMVDSSTETVQGNATYSLPDNLVSITQLDIVGNNVIYPLLLEEYQTIDAWDANVDAPVQGMPVYYAVYGSEVRLFPTPDRGTLIPLVQGYFLKFIYKGRYPAPEDTGSTNFWTTTAESLIRNRAKYALNIGVLRDPQAAALDKQAEMDAFRRIMIESAGKLFTRTLKATRF